MVDGAEVRLGTRLCENLIRLGIDAQIASEKDVVLHKEYEQDGPPIHDGRLYLCSVTLKDRSISHIQISSHYYSDAPISFEFACNIPIREGDIRRIKKLGRHLKAEYTGSYMGHHHWKGGRLAERLEQDSGLSHLAGNIFEGLKIEPYQNVDVRICKEALPTFTLTEEEF